MSHAFIDQLAGAVQRCGSPVCVGLDPRWEQLPAGFREGVDETNDAKAAQYLNFCREVIDVVAPLVPVVKPQAAFFEQLGPPGMTALAEVIAYATDKELLVILDAKRGDIGSTAAAYACGLLGCGEQSVWGADALTVNPYMGMDTIEPFLKVATARDAGLFVLVKTSNPGSVDFQDVEAGGVTVYRRVAERVEQLADSTLGECDYGLVGAVVGATFPEQLSELRSLMPHTWLLVPGYGAQGGTAADVAAAFDEAGLGAVVNNSRGIIFAHQRPEYSSQFGDAKWQQAVEMATDDMIKKFRAETSAGKL